MAHPLDGLPANLSTIKNKIPLVIISFINKQAAAADKDPIIPTNLKPSNPREF